MGDWKRAKSEASAFYKQSNYEKAIERYETALLYVQNSTDVCIKEKTREYAKVSSNISLMYLSLITVQLQQRKTMQECSELWAYAEHYASTSIMWDASWAKGHLRLAQVLRYTSIEDAADAMMKFMEIATREEKDSQAAKETRANIKYYTHKKVMMTSPSWHLVKHPKNCFSVDPEGGGHYQDLRQVYANSSIREMWHRQAASYLIRPGMYCCNFSIAGAKDLDLVGDCDVEIDETHHAITTAPSVRISNTYTPYSLSKKVQLTDLQKKLHATPQFQHMTPAEFRATNYHTFSLMLSTVTMSRLSLEEKIVKLTKTDNGINCISCNTSTLSMKECSVVSDDSASIFIAQSRLYMTACRSVKSSCAVRVASDSAECYLTDCYISKAKAMGVDCCREAKYLEMNRCTVTECGEQGVSLFHGAKMGKIINCKFDGNCYVMSVNEGNLMFECDFIEVRNTIITNSKGFGLLFQAGEGVFENLVIENSGTAGMSIGPVTAWISDCVIMNAHTGIDLHGNKYSGVVTLDNNVITGCKTEIFQHDSKGQKLKFERIGGLNKHGRERKSTYVKSIKDGDKLMGEYMRNFRKARRKGELDEKAAWQFSGCSFCQKTLEELGIEKFKVCGGCKVAQYCSAECQKKQWKQHKPQCDYDRDCQEKTRKKNWKKINAEKKKKENREKDVNEAKEKGNEEKGVKEEANVEKKEAEDMVAVMERYSDLDMADTID